jgi:hypothetical protein
MVPTLVKAGEVFLKNVDKVKSTNKITMILKSFAFLERKSINRTSAIEELDMVYEVSMNELSTRINDVSTLLELGDIIVSFGKITYYPEKLISALKSKIIFLFLSEKIERKNSGVYKKIVDDSSEIENLKSDIATTERQAQKVDRSKNSLIVENLADLKKQLRIQQIKTTKQIASFIFGTNSIFEMAKLITGLSNFASVLNQEKDDFMEEFYRIVLTSLSEIAQNNIVMMYFVKNTQLIKLIMIIRSSNKFFVHPLSSRKSDRAR